MTDLPKFVKVIVDHAHDTTKGRIYQVDQVMSIDEYGDHGGLWIKEDDVGVQYYLSPEECEVVEE